MKRIISIANQKGGVGKTTTAVNLAACFAAGHYPTLLIDFDPQGNATSGVGLYKDKYTNTLFSALAGNCDINQCIYETQLKFLKVIPSDINLAGLEVELSDSEDKEFVLKAKIAEIKEEFDFIIIDCPPSLGLLSVNALAASKEVIVPIQCEFYALEGLSLFFNTIQLIKERVNSELDFLGVLLTMYDPRTNLSKQVVEEALKFFKDKVFKTVIPRNVKLGEAPSFGKPIILYDLASKGAESYLQLAKEVMKNEKK